jgi:CBS domain containing-hemolysin-like protein
MGCWRRIEMIRWYNHVENEVLYRIKEERNRLPTIKGRKDNWISHILHRKCLLKHITEGRQKRKA